MIRSASARRMSGALLLGLCLLTAPVSRADEWSHREHERRESGYHEHEFREHEFRDQRYLDGRFHHDRYYPPLGHVFFGLPGGFLSVEYRGVHLFFSEGVWYRPERQGRYAVVAPSPGVILPIPPPFYTVVWANGLPYYYANNTYYFQTPQGYRVVDPPSAQSLSEAPPAVQSPPIVVIPAPAPAVAPQMAALFVYPRQNQSEQQTAKDRYDCDRWAAGQSGYDPLASGATAPSQAQADAFRRAATACLDARGYTAR